NNRGINTDPARGIDKGSDRWRNPAIPHARPVQAVRKRIGRRKSGQQQVHDAFIAPAIAGDDKAKPVGSVRQAYRQVSVLPREVALEILNAIVTEVAVQFAVERIFFIVERLVRRFGAFKMISRKRPPADYRYRSFKGGVEVGGEYDARL